MNIFKQTEKLAKKMKWYDFSILKLSVLFATLTLISGWTAFRDAVITVNWYWYLLITLILSGYLLKKMFSK